MLVVGLALLSPRTAAAAPAASFTFSPSNPSPGDTVTFTSTSSGDVVSRVWDIAGHPAPDSDTVSAVFVNPGTYRVRLTVIDSLGASSTARVATNTNKNIHAGISRIRSPSQIT